LVILIFEPSHQPSQAVTPVTVNREKTEKLRAGEDKDEAAEEEKSATSHHLSPMGPVR
jgi:hypothetical protein